jgi:hypothetical protein
VTTSHDETRPPLASWTVKLWPPGDVSTSASRARCHYISQRSNSYVVRQCAAYYNTSDMFSWATLGSVISLATTVLAHGYVQQIVTSSPAGTYTGYLPYSVGSCLIICRDINYLTVSSRIPTTTPYLSELFARFLAMGPLLIFPLLSKWIVLFFYIFMDCRSQTFSVQCNGYTDGGVAGSAPAPIYATVAAGSQVKLNWTEWPDSHVVNIALLGVIDIRSNPCNL